MVSFDLCKQNQTCCQDDSNKVSHTSRRVGEVCLRQILGNWKFTQNLPENRFMFLRSLRNDNKDIVYIGFMKRLCILDWRRECVYWIYEEIVYIGLKKRVCILDLWRYCVYWIYEAKYKQFFIFFSIFHFFQRW